MVYVMLFYNVFLLILKSYLIGIFFRSFIAFHSEFARCGSANWARLYFIYILFLQRA